MKNASKKLSEFVSKAENLSAAVENLRRDICVETCALHARAYGKMEEDPETIAPMDRADEILLHVFDSISEAIAYLNKARETV